MTDLLALLSQATGALGAVLVIAAFFLKNPRHILAVSFVASALWTVHFGLIDAWAGAIVAFASAARNAAGAWLERRAMTVLTWASVVFVIVFGLAVDSAGALVLLSAPTRAISNHLRDRELLFRAACAVSAMIYVAYGLMIGSPVWISSAITLAVILGMPLLAHLRAHRVAPGG